MKHQHYVAGFLFNKNLDRVALILKLKPDWQKGKWNAIGGKFEHSDKSLLASMVREFEEETGLHVEDWTRFCSLSGFDKGEDSWTVHFFYASDDSVEDVRIVEEELPSVFDVDELHEIGTLPNLSWLIPMALHCMRDGYYYQSTENKL